MKKALASLLGFLCSASMVIADSGFNYVKVKTAPEKWDGEYLIVCESQNRVFDGSLTDNLDVAKKSKTVTIENETIYVDKNKDIEKSQFTIASITGGYSIKSASGFYIANTTSDNNLSVDNSKALKNNIELKDGTLTIASLENSKNTYLQFNKASNQMRFRYFKTKGSQEPITLYKKVASAPDNRTPVNLTNFSAEETTLTKGNTTTTTVSKDPEGWTAKYTYSSDKESVATVDSSGVITAVSKGNATITVTAVVDANDTVYKAGETLTKSIAITVVNPKHSVTFQANGQRVSSEEMEEGSAITFTDDLNAQYVPAEQTFMGWTDAAINGTQETAPTYVESANVGTTDVTYYAVFATASTSENANWVKKKVSEVVSNPQDGDYALLTPEGVAFNGKISSGHGQSTTNAFIFTNNEAKSAPEGTCLLKITRKGTNGIEIAIKDGGNVITASKASSGGFDISESKNDTYWYASGENLKYYKNDAYLRTYSYTFRTYGGASNGAIAFAYRPSITYTNYCTTVGGADTREFVNLASWATITGAVTLTKGQKLATVATLNPAACKSATFAYSSSEEKVATINNEGVITAVSKGTATLKVVISLDEKDENYRIGGTTEKTLDIEVLNPLHTVTFLADGKVVESNEVREEEAIVFPAVTAPTGLVFAGWSAQNWEGMQYTEPAWVNTTATVMGETDLEFVAVFARVSQKGNEVKHSLTEEQIRNDLPNIGVDTWDTIVYNDGNVVWSGYVMTRSNGKVTDGFMRIKDNGSYICFDAPYAITNISFHSVNGSGSMTDGTFYLKAVPSFDRPSSDSFQTIPAKDTDFSIDVEGKHSKIYMQFSATTVANVSNIVLTCVTTPEQYAGYATSIAATEEIRTHVVTVADCGYTSVCLPYNAVASEDAKFFALKSVDGEGLHFSKTDILVAGQGYVLQGKKGVQYTLAEVTEAVDYNVNMLKGVVEQTNCKDLQLQGTGDYAYPWILAKDGTFKRYTGEYIPAGKAYLDGALLQDLLANQASALRVILEEDEVTALSQLHEEKATAPCYYNLQGQRVAQPRQAGALYIESNGRKIIVK